VQTSAAVFNPEKLLWVNEQYIKHSDPKQVAMLLWPHLKQAGLEDTVEYKTEATASALQYQEPTDWLVNLVVMVRERTKTLLEMVYWVRPYFGQTVTCDEEAVKKFLTPAIAPILGKVLTRFEAFPTFSKQQWEGAFKQLVEEEGVKMGQLAQPVRVALTGRTASPGLFDVMEVLGRDRTLFRLRQGIERASHA
jgi:glutamyl-tRNA synthetase